MAPPSISNEEMPFRWKALLFMVLLAVVYCTNMLLARLTDVILPFVVSFIIVAIIERPVEILHQMLTCRYDYEGAMVYIRASINRQGRRISNAMGMARDDVEPAPSAVAKELEHSSEDEEEEKQPLVQKGMFTMTTCWNSFARGLAVAIMLVVVLCIMAGLAFSMVQAAISVKDEISYYEQGAREWLDSIVQFVDYIVKQLKMDERQIQKLMNDGKKSALSFIENMLLSIVNHIISSISGFCQFALISFLYILFWLLEPLPVGWQANRLLRSYIKKKFIVAAGYALCVWLMFHWMGIGLAALFAQTSFFLSFIPELGPIISTLLPAPIILMDSRVAHPTLMFLVASLGQLSLKFFWGNIVEVGLIQADDEMQIHAVWIVLGLMYFGHLFGPIGMLVSVPMLALAKFTVNTNIPKSIAEPFNRCIEGRRHRTKKCLQEDV